MFAIPILAVSIPATRLFTRPVPLWIVLLCALGFLSTLLTFGLNAYPFDDATKPLPFATKILGITLLINLLGYAFYKLRNKPLRTLR
jgi:hypothetical protein